MLVEAADWDGAVTFALQQEAEGAAILDVCLMSSRRDELLDASQFYSRIVRQKHPPLMIDSLDAGVMEHALRFCRAGQFLNSISLEDETHLRRVCSLAGGYRAGVVIACRDEQGPAFDRHRKLDAALRAVDRGAVAPESVIIDLLAFPAATLPDGVKESLAAIEVVKHALPGVSTLLALSNFSFGMPAPERQAFERGILLSAAYAGLDYVILNTRRHPCGGVYDNIPIV
jgi:5-methyltetrahydrofolate--homocysteine methyltransferase